MQEYETIAGIAAFAALHSQGPVPNASANDASRVRLWLPVMLLAARYRVFVVSVLFFRLLRLSGRCCSDAGRCNATGIDFGVASFDLSGSQDIEGEGFA